MSKITNHLESPYIKIDKKGTEIGKTLGSLYLVERGTVLGVKAGDPSKYYPSDIIGLDPRFDPEFDESRLEKFETLEDNVLLIKVTKERADILVGDLDNPKHILAPYMFSKTTKYEEKIRKLQGSHGEKILDLQEPISTSRKESPESKKIMTLQEYLRVQAEILQSIIDDDFEVHAMPIVNIEDLKLAGIECLSRRRNRKTGDLDSPAKFINIINESDFRRTFELYVAEKSFKFAKLLKENGFEIFTSINIMPSHLDSDFTKEITALVQENNLEPSKIKLELLESEYTRNIGEIKVLREEGFKIAIDDFGEGKSNTDLLVRVDVDTVKIDGRHAKSMLDNLSKIQLSKGIISSIHDMGIETVFEGISDKKMHDKLIKHLCKKTLCQGWYYGKAMSYNDLKKLLDYSKNKPIIWSNYSDLIDEYS